MENGKLSLIFLELCNNVDTLEIEYFQITGTQGFSAGDVLRKKNKTCGKIRKRVCNTPLVSYELQQECKTFHLRHTSLGAWRKLRNFYKCERNAQYVFLKKQRFNPIFPEMNVKSREWFCL